MISFKKFCEDFNFFDSQVARKGSGPSVSSASRGGVMQKPAQVQTPVIGDITSFSGNNVFLIKNAKIPFDIKIDQRAENDFIVVIKYKGDSKFIPIEKTDLKKHIDASFNNKEDAEAAVQDLIFKISQIDL